MLSNHFLTAWRQLIKRPFHTSIHLVGLSVGLGCSLLAFMYVLHEQTFDAFHDHADQVYRVVRDMDGEGTSGQYNAFRGAVDWESVPGVEQHTWLFTNSGTVHTFVSDATESVEGNYFYTDPNFFDVFSFPFVQGDATTALARPDAIVLTESAARRFFPDGNAMGKFITRKGFETLVVTGVLKDLPSNSHMAFEFLISNPFPDNRLGAIPRFRYVRTATGVAGPELTSALRQLNTPDFSYSAQPLTQIHFYSKRNDELRPPGNRMVVYSVLAIAFFVLLMGTINYINLFLANASSRGKEVGVRKAIGAGRHQLVGQFLTETLLATLLAAPLTHGLIYLALPAFSTLTGQSLPFFGTVYYWGFLLVFVCLTGIASGFYPAFVLSGKSSTSAFKGNGGARKSNLRRGLVVAQFCITTGLLLSAVVMNAQMDFIRTTDVGWDREHLVVLPGAWVFDSESRYEVFQEKLVSHPGIANAARFSYQPGWAIGKSAVQVPETGVALDVDVFFATDGFPAVLGMEILDGESFQGRSVLINAEMSRQLQWDNPIGHALDLSDVDGDVTPYEITGVLEDAQFSSLHQADGPAVFMRPPTYRSALAMYVRIETNQVAEAVPFIEQQWREAVPSRPFEFSFVDERVQALYESENRLFTIAKFSTWLGVMIAAMGLFSLSATIAAQRTKEVGIRKVFGASMSQILTLFSTYFLRLFVAGFVIAVPASIFLLNQWLNGFAFRVQIGLVQVLEVGIISIALILVSISYQGWKAAKSHPIKALRTE